MKGILTSSFFQEMLLLDMIRNMLLVLVRAAATSIPMYFAWNWLAPIYFKAYLPATLLVLPYWHLVALVIVCTFIGQQIQSLVPRIT